MIFEGELIIFTAAVLAHQGYLNPLILFPFLFFSTILGDIAWYLLGLKINNHSQTKLYRFFAFIAKPFDEHFKSKLFRSIFISKFTYGLHHAVLVRLGSIKISFKKFLKKDLVATFAWIILISIFGFSAGASLSFFKHWLRYAELGIISAIMLFIITSCFINKILKKKL